MAGAVGDSLDIRLVADTVDVVVIVVVEIVDVVGCTKVAEIADVGCTKVVVVVVAAAAAVVAVVDIVVAVEVAGEDIEVAAEAGGTGFDIGKEVAWSECFRNTIIIQHKSILVGTKQKGNRLYVVRQSLSNFTSNSRSKFCFFHFHTKDLD